MRRLLLRILFFIPFFIILNSPFLIAGDTIQIQPTDTDHDGVQTIADSSSCKDLLNDTLRRFVRFDHNDGNFNFYYIRLSMFNSSFRRGYFYEAARTDECYMMDKGDFNKDSALFMTGNSDKVKTLHLFCDLYEQTIHASQKSSARSETGQKNLNPLNNVPTCDGAEIACSSNVYSFPAGTSGSAPPPVGGYPNYGCLGSEPCPAYFYMQVGVAGNIIITISQTNNHDVDFICWGPFNSLTDGCANGLTGTCNGPSEPTCCTNIYCAPNFYPRGNMTDCSYSPNATETCHILNAQVGQIYILLITNFSQQPGTITFQQTGGTGVTNCNLVVFCSMIAITATPSACDGATNTFSISGDMEFSNPPPTGTLTITDNTAVPPVSETFLPPFVTPLNYNLAGITCDGATHTLTAVFSDSTNCMLTQQCTSPPASCPQAQISGGGDICNDGISTVPVNISFTGTGPYNFTYAINGNSQPAIIHYSGPFPYVINANVPGTYTLVSVTNPVCIGSGVVSGSANVIVDPLPVPSITEGAATVCSGSTGVLYTTQPGNSNYLWSVSAGGVITAGGTTSDTSVTITWTTPGAQSVSINYNTAQGCTAATPTVFPVTVNPLPVPILTGDSVDCAETSGVIYTTQAGMTNYLWSVSSGGSITAGGSVTNNTVTVTWNTAGAQSVSVNYTNANGCTAVNSTTRNVTINPLPGTPGTITGTAVLCQGATGIGFTVGAASNALTYNWILIPANAGTINGNTTSITINWSATYSGTTSLTTFGINNCGNGPISSAFSILVNPKPIVSYTMCTDSITIPTASIIKLREGIPLGGTYSGPGVNILKGTFNPATAGLGAHTITYSYTNVYGCINTATKIITVTNPGVFNCGGKLKDVRDNKQYKTVLIGAQCWMAESLNYGTNIVSTQDQFDNCVPEKYCYGDNPANCTSYGGIYQWDELMAYKDSIGFQGICPAGWHVPNEAEWTLLFSNYINNGFAGNALKTTGYSGFNALIAGVNFFNQDYTFNNFGGFYWSSNSEGPFKAWAHGMNFYNPSVSFYPSSRSNAFSVRCIKN